MTTESSEERVCDIPVVDESKETRQQEIPSPETLTEEERDTKHPRSEKPN